MRNVRNSVLSDATIFGLPTWMLRDWTESWGNLNCCILCIYTERVKLIEILIINDFIILLHYTRLTISQMKVFFSAKKKKKFFRIFIFLFFCNALITSLNMNKTVTQKSTCEPNCEESDLLHPLCFFCFSFLACPCFLFRFVFSFSFSSS